MNTNNREEENLSLGMCQLIDQERRRLNISFVSGYEIWQNEDTEREGYEGFVHFELERGYPLLTHDEHDESIQLVSQETKKRSRRHGATREPRSPR